MSIEMWNRMRELERRMADIERLESRLIELERLLSKLISERERGKAR